MSQPTRMTALIRQAGFSMVELMVALLLGSIVVIAAVSLFTTNQRTFQLQQGLSDVQQQGRFALDYLAQDLRRLGYVQDRTQIPIGATVGLQTGAINVNGAALLGSTDNTEFNQSDRLTFTYFGTVDCEGDTGPEQYIGVTYWLNASRQLMCMGSVNPATLGLPLVEDVDAFQVLVGVGGGDPAQGIIWADEYRRLNAVNVAPGGDFVAALKVSLLIAADAPTGALPQQARNFQVLDQAYVAGVAPLNDNRIRRQFNVSVAVRNYNTADMPPLP